MKNNTCIILLPIQNGNCRTQLEGFENENFETLKDAQEYINEEGCKDFEILSISDFMDLSNNEEFYAANWWIGYITIKETF